MNYWFESLTFLFAVKNVSCVSFNVWSVSERSSNPMDLLNIYFRCEIIQLYDTYFAGVLY